MTDAAAGGQELKVETQTPDDPPSPVTMEFLAQRMNALFEQQGTLIKVVNRNSDHVLRLHSTIDPLTAKKRAALLFGGAFAGGGTAAFVMSALLHFLHAAH